MKKILLVFTICFSSCFLKAALDEDTYDMLTNRINQICNNDPECQDEYLDRVEQQHCLANCLNKYHQKFDACWKNQQDLNQAKECIRSLK